MPWKPTDPEKNFLRNQIRQRITDVKDDTAANKIIDDWLVDASGKKQAEAIVANTTLRKEIYELHEYGFDKITNNSPQAVKAALIAAPAGIAAAKQAAHAQALLNSRIDGYLATINNKYKTHRTGVDVAVPINDVVGTKVTAIARHYNNGEHRLPNGGNYIEWYPIVGGLRSTEKRFFTQRSTANIIWYTEGGTHGTAAQVWYRRVNPSTDWDQI